MPAHATGSPSDGGALSASQRRGTGRDGIGARSGLTALLLFCPVLLALLVARNPYLLIRPQMWTEDLLVYFMDDLILKSDAILIPYNGTIQLTSRLVAFVGGLFPTALVPAVYSASAVLAVAVIVGLTLVSSAFQGAARWAAVLMIFLVPVGSEVFLGMSYIQWILGPAVALALYERTPGRAQTQILLSAYGLVAFSSPIGAMAAPFALIKMWRERSRFAGWLLFLSVTSAIFMAAPVVSRVRSDTLAAPMADKMRAGLSVLYEWAIGAQPIAPWIAIIISLATVAVVLLFLWHHRAQSQRATFYFIGFGFVVLAASIAVSPTARLQQFGDAERYFYIPALLFVWALLSLQSGAWQKAKCGIIVLVCAVSYAIHAQPTAVLQSDMHWRDTATCIDRSADVCVSSVNPPYLGRFLVPSRPMLARAAPDRSCCLGYRMNAIISEKSLVPMQQPAGHLTLPAGAVLVQDFVVPAPDVPDTSPHLVDVRLSAGVDAAQSGSGAASAMLHWKVLRRAPTGLSLIHAGDQRVSAIAPSQAISLAIIGAKAGDALRVELTLDPAGAAAPAVDLPLFAQAGTASSAALLGGQPIDGKSLGLSIRYK